MNASKLRYDLLDDIEVDDEPTKIEISDEPKPSWRETSEYNLLLLIPSFNDEAHIIDGIEYLLEITRDISSFSQPAKFIEEGKPEPDYPYEYTNEWSLIGFIGFAIKHSFQSPKEVVNFISRIYCAITSGNNKSKSYNNGPYVTIVKKKNGEWCINSRLAIENKISDINEIWKFCERKFNRDTLPNPLLTKQFREVYRTCLMFMSEHTLRKGLCRQFIEETDEFMIYLYKRYFSLAENDKSEALDKLAFDLTGRKINTDFIRHKTLSPNEMMTRITFNNSLRPYSFVDMEKFLKLMPEDAYVKDIITSFYKYAGEGEMHFSLYLGIDKGCNSGLFIPFRAEFDSENDNEVDTLIYNICQTFDFNMEPRERQKLKQQIVN